ncbi:MAG: hypothetical protein ACYTF1_21780 [Planctomycetota bacterium]|jgi:hypothetical protein
MLKVCQLSLLCLLTLVFVAGCGDIKGSWILREHQPYLEKKDYKLAKITFFSNGSYQGLVSQDDKTLKMKGMYDYNPCSGDLILVSGDKAIGYRVSCLTDKQMCLDMCGPDNYITTAVMVRWCKCPYRPTCITSDPCRPLAACPPSKPCDPCKTVSRPCSNCP